MTFAAKVMQRVCAALILAAIFAMIHSCVRAATPIGSITGVYGGSSVDVEYSETATHFTVHLAYGGTGTLAVIGLDTIAGADGTGWVPWYNGTTLSAGTQSWTHAKSTYDPTLYHLHIVVQMAGGAYGSIQHFSFTAGAVDKEITLSYTNGTTVFKWVGWGEVGTPYVQELRYVAPSDTETWLVSSPAGDTKSYCVKIVDAAEWFAHGSVPKYSDPGQPTIWDFDGLLTEGAAKTHADGVSGSAGTAVNSTPVSPTSSPTGSQAATPMNPGNTSGGSSQPPPTGQVAPVVPGSPSGSPTQQSQADGTNAILDGLRAIGAAIGGLTAQTKAGPVGGGGGIDLSGVESRLDTANAHLNKLEEYAKNGDDFLTDAQKMDDHSEAALTAKAGTQGTAASSAFTSAMTAHQALLPDGARPTAPSGSGSWLSVEIPGYGTLNFSPYERMPWLFPFLNAAREVILWGLVAGFICMWLNKINEHALTVATTPQVGTTLAIQDMIPAAGQALSWLKGTITVAGVVTTLAVVYGVAVGLINSHMTSIVGSAMKAFMGGSAAQSAMGVASANPIWGVLLEMFPLNAFLALIVADVVFTAAMGPLFVGAALVVRSIRV